jgi:hypothetical protein
MRDEAKVVVAAHIVRSFDSLTNPAKYHEAIRILAPHCPLNVKAVSKDTSSEELTLAKTPEKDPNESLDIFEDN